ncbi:amidohydrolase family protein [Kaarinaea lacus]
MNRRQFLSTMALTGLGLSGCRYWPSDGLFNPCVNGPLPAYLKFHPLVQKAWEDIDPKQYWDCHTHLIGVGDSDSGIWVNPDMQSLMHPIQYTQFKFYINASCAEFDEDKTENSVDDKFVERLKRLHNDFKSGAKFMLIAFDYHYDEHGKKILQHSPFHTPNEYAAKIVRQNPQRFEWIASVHPYREDSLETLQWCVEHGAKAIKWLPGAMGIDPLSPKCDSFYEALVRFGLPLLTHSGEEQAVSVSGGEDVNNPLLMRRALDSGVTVIFAHCASLGESVDVDKNSNASMVNNLELFYRLLADKNYEGRVFGDISAITQVNRDQEAIEKIVTHDEWHHALINGSDYPLPGVLPIISVQTMADWGYIGDKDVNILSGIRRFNPQLFDFVLKRTLKIKNKKIKPVVFHSRRVFEHSHL